jgi:MFS family permease
MPDLEKDTAESTAELVDAEAAAEKGVSIMEDPLAEPTQSVGVFFVVVLALTNLGIWTAFFTPIQFLLPLQVEGMVGSNNKETNLSIVLTAGALVSLIASPLAGAFSDRTTMNMGRRRPWVLFPTIGMILRCSSR